MLSFRSRLYTALLEAGGRVNEEQFIEGQSSRLIMT